MPLRCFREGQTLHYNRGFGHIFYRVSTFIPRHLIASKTGFDMTTSSWVIRADLRTI